MARSVRYRHVFMLRLDDDLRSALKAEATRRECDVADLVRDLLCEGLRFSAAVQARQAVREVVRAEVDRGANRPTSQAYRAGLAAHAALYLLHAFLEATGRYDADAMLEQALSKAARAMKSSTRALLARLAETAEDEEVDEVEAE